MKSLKLVLIPALLLLVISGCGQKADSPVGLKDADALKAYFEWSPDRTPLVSAHRGGPVPGYPENALKTFQYSVDAGAAIIECDIRYSKDGVLVLMHDRSLNRTSTGEGLVSDYTLEELKRIELIDMNGTPTGDEIPTLKETLEWARDKAVLHLDIKDGIEPSHVVQEIRQANAQGFSVVIVYSFEKMMQYYHLDPDLMMSVTARSPEEIQRLKEFDISMKNLKIFVGVSEPDLSVYEELHNLKRYCILGTMHNLDNRALKHGVMVYQELYRNGADILSTDNVELVVEAIRSM